MSALPQSFSNACRNEGYTPGECAENRRQGQLLDRLAESIQNLAFKNIDRTLSLPGLYALNFENAKDGVLDALASRNHAQQTKESHFKQTLKILPAFIPAAILGAPIGAVRGFFKGMEECAHEMVSSDPLAGAVIVTVGLPVAMPLMVLSGVGGALAGIVDGAEKGAILAEKGIAKALNKPSYFNSRASYDNDISEKDGALDKASADLNKAIDSVSVGLSIENMADSLHAEKETISLAMDQYRKNRDLPAFMSKVSTTQHGRESIEALDAHSRYRQILNPSPYRRHLM